MQTALGLGLWMLTVLVGLALFALLVLPGVLWVGTRRNPLTFLRDFSKALVLAFGTSSCSAALPVTPLSFLSVWKPLPPPPTSCSAALPVKSPSFLLCGTHFTPPPRV